MMGLVVYDSVHGNTKAIAEAIAEQIKADGHQARLVNISSDPSRPMEGDIMFIGSPTRYTTMTGHTKKFIKKLDPAVWGNKPICAFETYGPVEEGKLADSKTNEKWIGYGAAKKIHDLLKERGFNIRWPVLRLAVTGIKGPLAPGQIEEAKKYAHDFVASLGR
jgi:flavodoxin